jgi:hypothetical protein
VSPPLLRVEGAGLPLPLPALLLRREAPMHCCSRSRFCLMYSVGSKRCFGGALLGRGGRGGVTSAGQAWHMTLVSATAWLAAGAAVFMCQLAGTTCWRGRQLHKQCAASNSRLL